MSFPEWGFGPLKAKLDTGARTSAIHATDLEPFERDGETWIRFTVHPWQRSGNDAQRVEAHVIDERKVKSSSGTESVRPVIEASIALGGVAHTVELTLTRRDDMGFRMLLGREALRGRYAVDPGRSYLTGRVDRDTRRKNRGRR